MAPRALAHVPKDISCLPKKPTISTDTSYV